jgi:hypothetical protein
MATSKNSKAGRTTLVGNLIKGSGLHLDPTQKVVLNGTATTVGAILTQLQSFVNNRNAVVAAQATARDAVATERAQAPALNVVIDAFEAFVRFTFGDQATVLSAFGLAPHKVPAPKTAEEKAVAAAKRKATRAARGTTSAKQKKSVKGNVTATLVVTPAAAPTPAPAEAPVAQPAPAVPAATPAPAMATPPKA